MHNLLHPLHKSCEAANPGQPRSAAVSQKNTPTDTKGMQASAKREAMDRTTLVLMENPTALPRADGVAYCY
jgi:hypothetical protein